jgi:hypothetical protein
MANFWISIFFLIISTQLWAQEKSVYGNVTDPNTQKGIDNLAIINTRTNQVVTTNAAGDFYIRAKAGDSVLIQSFAYNRKGIKWDGLNKNVKIFAKQEAIMLQDLVVIEKSTYELNKEILDFLSNPSDGKAIKNEILKSMLNTQTSQPGIGISIDALYEMFSKDGKERRKLADLQTADARRFYANLKYNPTLIARITQLEQDDLALFMRFCNPSEDFILRATDYELTKKILACLHDFRYRKINGTLSEFLQK